MPRDLKIMQEKFVAEYLISGNATRAAIAAGYSAKSAAALGHQLLKKPHVKAALAEKTARMLEKLDLSAERWLKEVVRIAFFDPGNLFNADGSLKNLQDLDVDTRAVITVFDVREKWWDSGGQVITFRRVRKIRWSNKLKALRLLVRILGLDRGVHSGGRLTLEQLVSGASLGEGTTTESAPEQSRDRVKGLMKKELTIMQEKFVAEYLISGNATRAAIAAGYSSAAKSAALQGHQLLKRPKVKAALAEKANRMLEKLDVSAERVLQEVARIAYFDPGNLFNADGSLKDLQDLDEDTRAVITVFDVREKWCDKQGQLMTFRRGRKISWSNKGKALWLLAQILGLDRGVHSDGRPYPRRTHPWRTARRRNNSRICSHAS